MKNKQGFTLIELLIGMVLTAIVLGVFSGALYHLLIVPARQSDHLTTINELRFALDYIEVDGAHARSFVNATDPGVPFSNPPYYGYFSWIYIDSTTGDSDSYIAAYRYESGLLVREESLDDAQPVSIVLASHVAEAEDIVFIYSEGSNMVTVSIKSTLNAGAANEVAETRTRVINMKPVEPPEIPPEEITTLTLYASKDSYVYKDSGNTNYGTSSNMWVGCKRSWFTYYTDRYRSLVGFDLSSIPQGATIISAQLRLYCYSRDYSNPKVYVHRITASWQENTVTWNNQPGNAGSSNYQVVSQGSWTTWNVSSDVQAFVDGYHTNHGWKLKSVSNGTAKFYTRQSMSDQPELVVTYH